MSYGYELMTPGRTKFLWRKHFNFTVPPTTPILIHQLRVDGDVVGYVATENYKNVGGPHIYIMDKFKTKHVLTAVSYIFKEIYCKDMKDRGMIALCTNCDKADRGTKNFLAKIGFTLKEVTIAEIAL